MDSMQEPIKQTMKSSAVRDHWSEVVNDVFTKKKTIRVKKSGLTVLGLVPPEDLQLIQEFKAEKLRVENLLDKISTAFEGVPEEEIQREIEKAQLEVWEEYQRNTSGK